MRPIGAASLGGAQVIRIGTSAALPDGLHSRSVASAGEPAATAAAVQKLFDVVHGGKPHQVIVVAADAPRWRMPAAAWPPRRSADPADRPGRRRGHCRRAQALRQTVDLRGRDHAIGANGRLPSCGASAPSPAPRCTGEDATPVGNAIAVARFADGSFGWGVREPGHGLVFVGATRPFDAPAAAILSATGDYAPLLLLNDHVRCCAC